MCNSYGTAQRLILGLNTKHLLETNKNYWFRRRFHPQQIWRLKNKVPEEFNILERLLW